jgi:hypothetical protein
LLLPDLLVQLGGVAELPVEGRDIGQLQKKNLDHSKSGNLHDLQLFKILGKELPEN